MNDPDPTTQMAWPTSHKDDEPLSPQGYRPPLPELLPNNLRAPAGAGSGSGRDPKLDENPPDEIGRKRLTPWNLFCLSISMAGAQVVWTVELGCVVRR